MPSLNATVPVAAEGVTVAVNVTVLLYVDGFSDDTTAVELAVPTVCTSAGDVPPPLNTAVMECVPAARVEVVKIPVPPVIVAVPRVVVPSLTVAVPLEVDGRTVTVKLTELPEVYGLTDEATVTVVLVPTTRMREFPSSAM